MSGKIGEVRALITNYANPFSILAAINERLAAKPKTTFILITYDEEEGDWEWKTYGTGISVGSLLYIVEEFKNHVMNIGRSATNK